MITWRWREESEKDVAKKYRKTEQTGSKKKVTHREILLVKEGSGLADFSPLPGVQWTFHSWGAAWLCQLPLCTTPPHTHRSVASLCVCVCVCVCVSSCAHTLYVYSPGSNCADICVSFVLLSLKPHNTCHLSQMAGCLPKMQMDDNKLYLQSKATRLGAVNIGPSISYMAAGWRLETHTFIKTVACKE